MILIAKLHCTLVKEYLETIIYTQWVARLDSKCGGRGF